LPAVAQPRELILPAATRRRTGDPPPGSCWVQNVIHMTMNYHGSVELEIARRQVQLLAFESRSVSLTRGIY